MTERSNRISLRLSSKDRRDIKAHIERSAQARERMSIGTLEKYKEKQAALERLKEKLAIADKDAPVIERKIRHLAGRIKKAREKLAGESLIELSADEARTLEIDKEFPYSPRNSVVRHSGKYFVNKYVPDIVSPHSKDVLAWTHEWMEIDPKHPLFYTSTDLTEADYEKALANAGSEADLTRAERIAKILRLAGKIEMTDGERIQYMCDALAAGHGTREIEFEGVRYRKEYFISDFKRYNNAGGGGKRPVWDDLGWRPVEDK